MFVITEKIVHGTYTSMLRMVLRVSWKDHVTNNEVYGALPKVTSKTMSDTRKKNVQNLVYGNQAGVEPTQGEGKRPALIHY